MSTADDTSKPWDQPYELHHQIRELTNCMGYRLPTSACELLDRAAARLEADAKRIAYMRRGLEDAIDTANTIRPFGSPIEQLDKCVKRLKCVLRDTAALQ